MHSVRTSNRRVLASLLAGVGALLAIAFFGVIGAAPTGAQTPTTACTAVFDGDLEKYLADLALCGASTETSAESTTSTTASGRSSSSGTSSSGTGSSTLPTTGSNTAPLLAVGGALVLVGGAAVYGSTRVRRTA